MLQRRDPRLRRQSGFTLAEAIIVVAIVGILILIGLPSFLGTLTRTRLTGSSRQVATLFQVARLEAIKVNAPVKIVHDAGLRRFYAFVDQDRDGIEDAGERRLPASVDLSLKVQFRGPGDSAPNGANAIDGWDDAPIVNGPSFRFDGSVDRVGAFRLSDVNGLNIIEVRVETPATGRVVLKKYDNVATKFYTHMENDQPWTWY
jgi:prepilin-type N-terminal cleavage/methylation domain-containing protein